MKKFRDSEGNLNYKCWKCNGEFNFKAMKYITESEECPKCEAEIKLKAANSTMIQRT